MSKEEEIKKLKDKIQDLQKVVMELTKSSGKLALENMDLKKKLDKKTRK